MSAVETVGPKVSVIVSAYNAENYLKRCLDSLAAQTYTDFEAILVDDGSRDKTGEICDLYSKDDSRFKVIHQKNQGVSAARQNGLNAAIGEYTIHLDSDDWVEPDMLEVLVKKAKETNPDLILFDILVHNPGGKTECWKQQPLSLDHWTVLGLSFYDLYGCVWNKLIKRETIIKNKLAFDPSLKACEDQLFVLSFLANPVKIQYIDKPFYHYDKSQNSNSFVNSNPLVTERIYVLERFASKYDITMVQEYFDRAILHIAFEALYLPADYPFDFQKTFSKHRNSIKNAKGLPLRVKLLVLLRLHGINIPIAKIKRKLHQ